VNENTMKEEIQTMNIYIISINEKLSIMLLAIGLAVDTIV